MPEEKESTVTTPEAAVILALSEEELKKIAGGVPPFTLEQLEVIERMTASKAPTTMSRGTQAAVGTALGFGANYAGTIAGDRTHTKK